jgi:hypothetical protein
MNCNFSVDVLFHPACPTHLTTATGQTSDKECGGVGVCTSQLCDCNDDRQEFDCSDPASNQPEMVNNLVFGKSFKPRGNSMWTAFTKKGPTNSNITFKVKPFKGTLDSITDNFDTFFVGKNNVVFPGTIQVFIRYDDPPEVQFNITPIHFPYVQVNVTQAVFDFQFVRGTTKRNERM